MAIVNLTVVKSTPSTKGGHILKLQSKAVKQMQTPFGLKKVESQETYYMKVEAPQAVGFMAPLDTDQFAVVERAYTVEDPNSEIFGQSIPLKWLQLK